MPAEEVHIHVHVHTGESAPEVLETLQTLTTQGAAMAADLSTLIAEVQETQGVSQSAVVLITGLRDQVNDLIETAEGNAVDVAQLEQLRDALDSSNTQLSQAVSGPGEGGGEEPPTEPVNP
jgi:ABC-type transporter Mla subunit MlaD